MLPNVPLTGQSLGVTRIPINSNFSTIDTAFTINHIQYNDGSGNQGMHNFVQMPIPSTTPVTAANQVGLYSRVSTFTSQPELVFSHQFGSTAPATAQIVEFTSAGWASPGWTRLPSGILLKWGTFTSAAGANTLTYPTGSTIPAFATTFNVTLTIGGTTGNIYLTAITSNLAFSAFSTSTGTPIVWYLAIGV